MVIVGPPLLANGPSFGSTFFKLLPPMVIVFPKVMLKPASWMAPKPAPPDLLVARIVPARSNEPPPLARLPPWLAPLVPSTGARPEPATPLVPPVALQFESVQLETVVPFSEYRPPPVALPPLPPWPALYRPFPPSPPAPPLTVLL